MGLIPCVRNVFVDKELRHELRTSAVVYTGSMGVR